MTNFEDDLLKNLLSTFKTEAADHVQTLNQALLKLERLSADDEQAEQQRQELLQDAFRAAHSLKGAARTVSLKDIEILANGLEGVLHAARDGKLSLAPAICDVLYEALDTIQQLLYGQPVALEDVYKRLTAIDRGDSLSIMPERSVVADAQPGALLPPGSAADGNVVVAPGAADGAGPGLSSDDTIRVALNKLDDLMAQVGELLISRLSAEQHLTDLQDLRRQIARWPKTWREIQTLLPRLNGDVGKQLTDILSRHNEQEQALSRGIDTLHQVMNRDTLRTGMVVGRLQDSVRLVRMVRFQTLVFGLQRAVRDAARSEGKEVLLRIEGDEVELDKKVLEMLKDPLLHLLRNAVSHGIEDPARRQEQGKPALGQVVLSVQQRGAEVRIAVSDDGRGFDLDGLRKASALNGHAPLDENASAAEIVALAFQPGVTTSAQVTPLSGRGVGLDVVRRCLEAIQGRVQVDTSPGKGTTIQLLVPTSVAMTRGLLVQSGSEQYVLPLLSVEKIVELKPEAVFRVEGRSVVTLDNRPLPLVSLAAVLGRPLAEPKHAEKLLAAIIAVAEQRLAVVVDSVLTEQELAVKPMGRLLTRVRNVSGAALLGDGKPVVVLNPADLVKSARRAAIQSGPVIRPTEEEAKPSVRILVVDDSITTRTLEKNILETAGYEVITATDGLGALKQLEEQSIEVVVADIQMPHMDGFALTEHLRQSPEYSALPIILVTSLDRREDRERGMVAGANAYIIKRGFDQAELLATIEGLL